MLGGNNTISKYEHRIFFGLTFLGLALRLIEIVVSIIFPDPNPNFGIYSIFHMWEMMSPLYSVVGFLICIVCAWKPTIPSLTCSILPIALLVFFFDWWLLDSRRLVSLAAQENPGFEFKTFDFAVVNGSFYDFASLCLVNILLVWQIVILVRLVRTNQ